MIVEKLKQLLSWIVTLDYCVTNVGAIEAGNEDLRSVQPQSRNNFPPGQLISGRSERDSGNLWIALVEQRELDVFRAKIISRHRWASLAMGQ